MVMMEMIGIMNKIMEENWMKKRIIIDRITKKKNKKGTMKIKTQRDETE